jgi:hypothetical protein
MGMDRSSTMRIALALVGLLAADPGYAAAPNLPDHDRTPGALDPDITQVNYREILCANGKKHHTTDAKRPTSSYTTSLKKLLVERGYPPTESTSPVNRCSWPHALVMC